MKKTTRWIIGGLCLSCMCSAIAAEIPASKIVVPAGCARTNTNEYVVKVPQRSNMPNSTVGLVFRPSARQLAGKTVVFSAEMRGTDIASDAAGSHIGGKILVSYQDGEGMRYFASKFLKGTAEEWEKYSCELYVPADARNMTVTFGIQQGWGTLEIRNPRMDYDAPAAKSSGPSLIPASKIVVPAGCSRTGANEYAVKVPQRDNMPNSTVGLVFRPNARQLAGKTVVFSAEMRGTDIASDAAGDHIGGKILVSYQDGEGMRYLASKFLTGTAEEWEKYSCELYVPADARNMTVTFGIQQGWGTLEIRNPRMDYDAPAAKSSGPSLIPASKIVVPAGCSRTGANEYAVKVPQRDNMPNSTVGLVFRPNARQLAGKTVVFSAEMRGTDIASDAAGDHIGGKILVSYQDGEGMRYFASKFLTGTAEEWEKYSCELYVPADARNMTVTFGIQQGWGTLEVSNPSMTVE